MAIKKLILALVIMFSFATIHMRSCQDDCLALGNSPESCELLKM